jgi:hypothetical protein
MAVSKKHTTGKTPPSPPAPRRKTRGEASTISLTINRHGRIQAEPFYASVGRGPIIWTTPQSDAYLWAVRFLNNRSPLSSGALDVNGHGGVIDSSPPPRVGDIAGHFAYAVAVSDGERIYLDATCPEVIIEPGV